ncbi:MAG: tRNA uridine-5-carboxymethylaminomethyl(34) synthesis GTPase MnmE [Rhodospirillales bacterium]
MTEPTIYALASGRPAAAIAVIRISGRGTAAVLRALNCGAALDSPRHLVRSDMATPSGELLDDGMAVWFPGPASYTGEDAAELHVHGGRATIEAVLATLGQIDGLRMAEPGEFSRRAFDNGKLDLARVEGLADLISAETEAQRRQALRQLSGVLGRACEDWRARLIGALAHMEASIDFSDEDLPDTLDDGARAGIAAVRDEIAATLDDSRAGERLRDGLVVAIVGAPNAGKSSLLNALARRDAAIVTDIAGTTRDLIEVAVAVGGYPLTLIDTAGLRDSDDPVEQEGIRRARAAAAEADIRLVVIDGASWPAVDPETAKALGTDGALGVVSKADLAGLTEVPTHDGEALLAVSVVRGDGLSGLETRLAQLAAARLGGSEAALITRARHRQALAEAREALERALDGRGAELWAEDLRYALSAMGRIVGRVDVDDVLDIIFRDFCIGK